MVAVRARGTGVLQPRPPRAREAGTGGMGDAEPSATSANSGLLSSTCRRAVHALQIFLAVEVETQSDSRAPAGTSPLERIEPGGAGADREAGMSGALRA